MERTDFETNIRKVILQIGCTAQERDWILKDPNFLLAYFAKYRNVPAKTFFKMTEMVIEEYNPSTWRGKATHNGAEFNRTFPEISEFHKFYKTLYIPRNPNLKPVEGDGEGLPGIAEFLKNKVNQYKQLSPEERRQHALAVPEMVKTDNDNV